MASTVPVNLTVEQGADFLVEFNLRNESNSFLNLAGYSVSAQFARNYYSTTPKFSLNASIPVDTQDLGLVQLELSAAETTAFKAGRYVYSLVITNDATGEKDRYIEGIVTVTPGVL
jgi:hypothetical protein